ncbi:MAG: HD domain-containing protein, partial [Chloroflexota bacterium]|nr:HD domain-containing protein [Chloroflexota bacterium]
MKLSRQKARSWYPENDPVHGFDHILRVYKIAERLAEAEGADLEIVRAAALLHDVDGDQSSARESHQHSAAAFAEKVLQDEGWPDERIQAVAHCIRAHRFRDDRERPETLEAQVVFDADKLDAIGAIGAVRAIGYAILAGQSLYTQPSEQFLQSGKKESGEPHTPYHEYIFKLSKLKQRMYTSTGRAL